MQQANMKTKRSLALEDRVLHAFHGDERLDAAEVSRRVGRDATETLLDMLDATLQVSADESGRILFERVQP